MLKNSVAALLPIIFTIGCASTDFENPSFPLTAAVAKKSVAEMKVNPVKLDRPVLILGGFMDPGMGPRVLTRKFRRLTEDTEILGIGFFGMHDLAACQDRVLGRIEARIPSPNEAETVEFDVIGLSMGGLVARLAALDQPEGRRRLKIHRLYTIATPHRGAVSADQLPLLMKLQREMRSDSEVIAQLAASKPNFQIIPYTRLGDKVVGVPNSAPPGELPWWLPTKIIQPSHNWAFFDSRIVAELASQLRGEGGFVREPRSWIP